MRYPHQSKDAIIKDLQAKLSPQNHSIKTYQEQGGIPYLVIREFGSWNNGIATAFSLSTKTKSKLTKIQTLSILERYIEENQCFPTVKKQKELGIFNYLRKYFHNAKNALSYCKSDTCKALANNALLQQKICEDVRNVLTENNLSKETYLLKGNYSEYAITSAFTNWNNVLLSAFPADIVQQWNNNKFKRLTYTAEDVLLDYIDVCLQYGDYHRETYRRYGKYNLKQCVKFWGNWSKLFNKAAIQNTDFYDRFCPSKKLPVPVSPAQYKKQDPAVEQYPDIKLIEQVEQYYYEHQGSILNIDFIKQSQIKTSVIRDIIRRYGGWNKFLEKTRIFEYEKAKTLAKFKKEVEEIIQENGYFSMKLHKDKPGTLHHTKLRDMFGSLAQLRIEADLDVPEECYTSRTWAYTDQEYSNFLWKLYNKYGFISSSLIDNEPNHIKANRIRKHFGTIEAACERFGVPYIAPAHRSKFYFEIEAKACNILQTKRVQEKTWPWLKYKSKLRCDLFFPLLNLVIEIDGPQHYKNIRFFNESDERYYTALKRDQIKNEELPKHGIDLVRISSKNVKQIEKILAPYKAKRDLIYGLCAF